MPFSVTPIVMGTNPKHPYSAAELMRLADGYLDECFARESPPRVSELAARLNRTPLQLSRAFHKINNVWLSDYLQSRQIARAKHLLQCTAIMAKAIARMTGHTSSRSFHRAFRRATQLTPLQFRNDKNALERRNVASPGQELTSRV